MSTSTKRIIIFATILVVFAAVVFALIVSQVITKQEQLIAQKQALQEEKAQEASRIALERLAGETEADREQLSSYFFQQQGETVNFLNQIEAIAPQVGVSLDTAGLDIVTDDNEEEWIEVMFAFSGTRSDVQRFIRILETVPVVSKLTSVNVSAQTSQLWQSNTTMQIKIVSYENE